MKMPKPEIQKMNSGLALLFLLRSKRIVIKLNIFWYSCYKISILARKDN